jgi:hypothetical protein
MSPIHIILLVLIIINCLILLRALLYKNEKFIVKPPMNFGNFYSNSPKFYDNCDGDHKLISELYEGDYTLDDLSQFGFFNSNSGSGIDCVNVTNGYNVILYDRDNFMGNKIILTSSEKNYLYNNDFNLKIMSLKIRTVPLVFIQCYPSEGRGLLFDIPYGRYTFKDLQKRTTDQNFQFRSLYIPTGFRVKIFYEDYFNNILIDTRGPYYNPCIKQNDEDGLKIGSIIVEEI